MNTNRFFHGYAVLRAIATTNRCFRTRPSFCGNMTCLGLGISSGGASSRTLSRRILSNSSAADERFSSSSTSIDTPSLRGPAGGTSSLLKGLDIHTVLAEDDGHPLAVYTIQQHDIDNNIEDDGRNMIDNSIRIPVLLLHGRTWSSLPVYHLIGEANKGAPVGSNSSENSPRLGEEEADDKVGEKENRSLLQALHNNNIQPYAMDFRGFGSTPRSAGGFVEPLRCVADAVSVLNWIRDRHQKHYQMGEEGVATNASCKGRDVISRPALLGWSHGALIAQITAQRHPELVSKLIL